MTTQPFPRETVVTAAASLLTAHPYLSAEAIDAADIPGLGLTALIQVPDTSALRAWAQALHLTAHTTGASAYGTEDPHQDLGTPQWMWWRMTYVDTAIRHRPIRLWTLDTTDQRTLSVFLAASAHTPTPTHDDQSTAPVR